MMRIRRLYRLGTLVAVTALAGAPTVGGQEAAMAVIHADTDWYRDRPEAEREWRGTLRERKASVGPTGRPALAFELVTPDEKLPVYAAGVKLKLAPFVGAEVVARGKRVDLTTEGYGPELWIGSLRRVAER